MNSSHFKKALSLAFDELHLAQKNCQQQCNHQSESWQQTVSDKDFAEGVRRIARKKLKQSGTKLHYPGFSHPGYSRTLSITPPVSLPPRKKRQSPLSTKQVTVEEASPTPSSIKLRELERRRRPFSRESSSSPAQPPSSAPKDSLGQYMQLPPFGPPMSSQRPPPGRSSTPSIHGGQTGSA